jgi:hypothetical protein
LSEATEQWTRPKKAFRRLLRAIVSDDGLTLTRAPSAEEVAAAGRTEATRAVMTRELVAGVSAPHALTRCVRDLARRGYLADARSLTRAARAMPRLREVGRAAAVVIAVESGHLSQAGDRLRRLPRDVALRLVPAEVVAVEFSADPAAAVATGRALLDRPARPDAETWLDLARHALARDQYELSQRALHRIAGLPGRTADELRREASWLENWVERARAKSTPAPTSRGHVAVAVLDYNLPDYHRTSANVGDYVQTLASLGHLARHRNVRFHGEPQLRAQVTGLQARVPAEAQLGAADADVRVVPVNRDASSLDPVPEGTWMLAFGWYMHGWFRVHYDFPFHPHLRPLFVSFHVSRPELLSPEGVAYLRQHAPIGCRDWPTVRRLLGLGIPAFFTGCLTSTVDLLFDPKPRAQCAAAPVAFVDMPHDAAPPYQRPVVRVSHASLEVREQGLTPNLERGMSTLEAYRHDFSSVVTSRLHCYLPARALGVDVRFAPRDEADPRFDGLVGLDDAAFEAMQRGIRDRLEVVLTAVLSGADERTVRATWRELCEHDVEAARAATASAA